MLRRLLHSRLWLRRRAGLARGAESRVLQSRSQERASQKPHAFQDAGETLRLHQGHLEYEDNGTVTTN